MYDGETLDEVDALCVSQRAMRIESLFFCESRGWNCGLECFHRRTARFFPLVGSRFLFYRGLLESLAVFVTGFSSLSLSIAQHR